MTDVKVGAEIKAGQFLLLSSGEYSDYSVWGLYRAKKDFIMPGRVDPYGYRNQKEVPDGNKVAADPELVEEVEYVEVWCGSN